MPKKVLRGHTSPATAFVIEDYPYGFTLRCRKRYWLEFKAGKGFRLVSQTTNPKIKEREVWNTPKASTYIRFSATMFLDDENHVQWAGVSEYTSVAGIEAFIATYEPEGIAKSNLVFLLAAKREYEARKARVAVAA